MHKNVVGLHALSAAVPIVVFAVFGFATRALADDPQSVLYHVQENTYGCADPAATRALTNPNEPRRSSGTWIKSTMDSGRCVSITPRSPWKLVSQDNGVALMEYAGNVGPPGSYYIAAGELVDATGNRPGNAPAVAPTTGAAPTVNNASETALAPGAPSGTASAAPDTPRSGWSTWDVLLLLVAIAMAGVVGFFIGRTTAD